MIYIDFTLKKYKLLIEDGNYVIMIIVLHHLDLNHVQNLLVLVALVQVQTIPGM